MLTPSPQPPAPRLTLSRLVALGIGGCLLLTMLLGAVAVGTARQLEREFVGLQTGYWEDRLDAEELRSTSSRLAATRRGFLLTGDPAAATQILQAQAEFERVMARIQADSPDASETRALERISRDAKALQDTYAAATGDYHHGVVGSLGEFFQAHINPSAQALEQDITAYASMETNMLERARVEAADSIRHAIQLMMGLVGLSLLLGIAIAFGIIRSLSRQVGGATAGLYTSTAELQAAASQQASAAAEQATAMNEMSSTMKELLTSSQQITESARRVARIAEDTALGVRTGEGGVARAQEAMAATRRQIDAVVAHMVDLGRKSQQIGGVLDIIRELAEQTNILAINATIEAAGAGDHGKRFGAVADEVRKLAGRVTDAARDIRTMIDDVRSAANTTLMATEDGSKAVDTGHRQVAELALAFGQIAGQVGTTSDAAREIELGTKQQATAVEQVTFAISDAAQAAKEGEASSRQTLETATLLTGVARDLSRLVSPEDVRRAR